MFEKKLHYKMYKSGKHWVFAAITSIVFGAAMVNDVSADAVDTSSSDSQVEQVQTAETSTESSTSDSDSVANAETTTDSAATGNVTNESETQATATDQVASAQQQATTVENTDSTATTTENATTTATTAENAQADTTSNTEAATTTANTENSVTDDNAQTNNVSDTTATAATATTTSDKDESAQTTTQVNIDGNWYLQDASGNFVSGFQTITDQNKTVYYDPTTYQMQYGQQNIDGYWYLFDTFDGAMQTGLQYIKDQQKLVYYNADGQMQYGTVEIDGEQYHTDAITGAIIGEGQQKIAGHWYLYSTDNKVVNSWQYIADQGKTVYYDQNTAQMVYGQQNINGHWYLFDQTTGAMQRGFQNLKDYGEDKTVYYNQDGWMLYGQQKIDGYWYLFDTFDGAMQTGLQTLADQNKTVYYADNGQMQYGWQWVDNATRYFDTFDGVMVTGQQKIADHWYLFDQDGAMQRGFQNLKDYGEDKTVYYNQDGWMLYGWQWVENATRYFDTFNGAMATGQQKIAGHWYLFDQDGAMQRGFQFIPEQDKLVYYNQDGWMLYGEQNIDGVNYTFNTFDGALEATGQQKIAGHWYLFDENGNVLTGFQDLSAYGQDKVVYYDPTTAQILYGYQNIDGNWYLFDSYDGSLQKGIQTVNNVTLSFDTNTGALLTGVQNINGDLYYVDPISGTIKKNLMLLNADNTYTYFDATTGKGTNALTQQYEQGVESNNAEFVANNAAYSFDGDSFENVNGFLTADSWYRPKEILVNGTTWQASTESDFRPLLMTWWPDNQIRADYINFMKDNGLFDTDDTFTSDSDSSYMDYATEMIQRNIESKITTEGNTDWLRILMQEFVKTEDIWNENSEDLRNTGMQKFQGGFLTYVNSDLTPWANSDYRKLGYQPAMISENSIGPEFLLANDVDNSNPVVQAEDLNWLHYLMNFGEITANDPSANFDGIRIDAVDNMDASILSLAGDYLRAHFNVGANDATANQHISILEDWDNRDATYTNSIGNPELTMDDYLVQQMKYSLGQSSETASSMKRFLEWYLVDRSVDNTENTAIPNYAFVRAHDASMQEDLMTLMQDKYGRSWGASFTVEEYEAAMEDYMEDQKATVKHYNRYNIPSSYAMLLTNKDVIPRVYYGDLFTDNGQYMETKSIYYDSIDNLLKTRIKYVSGGQTMDVDQNDILTSVRLGKNALNASDTGTAETRTTGIGLIISNNSNLTLADGDTVVLHMGAAHKNQAYRAAMIATDDGILNYASDDGAPIAYTDENGDLIFTNKDLVVNGQVQANTAIRGVLNPYVSGYVALWVPVGASETQDARTEASTEASTDGSVFHSNAALDSNVIYEGFSNFQAFPSDDSKNANALIAQNAELFKSWGVTSFQLAPQYVSTSDGTFIDSTIDNGYAFSDRYDLAMSKNNKYGSYQDLINAIKALHSVGIQVIADYVPDQVYSLSGQEVVTVVRTDEYGGKIDGTALDNVAYVVNTVGGGQYQAEYGGKFLEELQEKYPTLFTTKQVSTGETIDPSEKITQWSAKYFNGTNVLRRGVGYVLHDSNQYYRVAETDEVFLPSQLEGKVVDNGGEPFRTGFWTNEDGTVNYYDDMGKIMTNAFVKDGKNNWYYFDENGNMVSNTALQITTDNTTAEYYFLANGVSVRNGFLQTASGDTYYYDENGRKLINGKVTVSSVEYTTDATGKVVEEKVLQKLDEIETAGRTSVF
ncbi:glycoside hydrolase family 70 protein [Ligilactobacillus apodemi]|uniref:glycoside hydrolase family 70 protein n=1 Tax=Ligilactobacillus apodemi TaxID=307126 RepID=UPI00214B05F9|nr:glycoside hydrolase family 70 protein [Ligilactobacillus apodemi]MCR1901896.1 KxYKxGKxW signal peptide domain-containing protein [Ligilactobacillus apodemi]